MGQLLAGGAVILAALAGLVTGTTETIGFIGAAAAGVAALFLFLKGD